MRSGTSLFDLTVFKKTVARFWPIWAAWLVGWLLIMPFNTLMELRRMLEWGAAASDRLDAYADILYADMKIMLPGAVVFGAIAAMAVFSHLYNSRSANLYGSLPVRREGLFLTHYTAGLAFLVVPNAVTAALMLAVEAFGGAVDARTVGLWLAVGCGECLFFYSFAVFCGMFAGHILALPAFYAIFNFLAAALMFIIRMVLDRFYYGFAGMGEWSETLTRWLTPTVHLSADVGLDTFSSSGVALDGAGTVAAYAAAGVVLALAAFFLYRARRLESAGDVVAVRPMRPVFKYSVSFCAGLFLGTATAAILGGGDVLWMAAIVIWAVAGCFVAQMILDKSFRVFKKWKGPVVMGLVFCALFAVVAFDLTGYETRVPDPEDVASVDVERLWVSGWNTDNADRSGMTVEDPELIRCLTILHRAAVARRDEDADVYASTSTYVNLELTYRLRGGSTLSRYYHFEIDTGAGEVEKEGSPAWALDQIFADRDLYWQAYGFDELHQALDNGGRLTSVVYNNSAWWEGTSPESKYVEQYGEMEFRGATAQALLDAVEADFRSGDAGRRHVDGSGSEDLHQLTIYYDHPDPSGSGRTFTGSIDITLTDSAARTMRVLDEAVEELLADNGLTEDGAQ